MIKLLMILGYVLIAVGSYFLFAYLIPDISLFNHFLRDKYNNKEDNL